MPLALLAAASLAIGGRAGRRCYAAAVSGGARGRGVRPPAGLGCRRGGAQGWRQRDRRRLRHGAGAGGRPPRGVRDRGRRLRRHLPGQGEEGLRARLPRAGACCHHATGLLQGRQGSARAVQARRAGGGGPRRGAGALGRWYGAGGSCRSPAVSTARRSWRRAVSRFPGGWRGTSATIDRNAPDADKKFMEIFAGEAARRGGDLAAARSGLDARQAARGGRRRVLQGRGGQGDRRCGRERGRRAHRRGPGRLHRDGAEAAFDRLPRLARLLDAAAFIGRRRADRGAGDPERALSGGCRSAARGARLVGGAARPLRGAQARLRRPGALPGRHRLRLRRSRRT